MRRRKKSQVYRPLPKPKFKTLAEGFAAKAAEEDRRLERHASVARTMRTD